MDKDKHDVFLSYNRKDQDAVRRLANKLKHRGLKVWIDECELAPGQPWQPALQEIIKSVKSAAVAIGKDGVGPWQNLEIQELVSELVDLVTDKLRDIAPVEVFVPKVILGSMGYDAVALGGAMLPFYSTFAPDKTVLLKGVVPKRVSA